MSRARLLTQGQSFVGRKKKTLGTFKCDGEWLFNETNKGTNDAKVFEWRTRENPISSWIDCWENKMIETWRDESRYDQAR